MINLSPELNFLLIQYCVQYNIYLTKKAEASKVYTLVNQKLFFQFVKILLNRLGAFCEVFGPEYRLPISFPRGTRLIALQLVVYILFHIIKRFTPK